MKSLNSLLLEGNVVRDPVSKTTPNGKHVATFSVATNRYYKSGDGYGEEVSYFDVETWGKMADLVMENCTPGRGVRVVGRLKQNRWVGTDGKNYSKVTVVAEHVEYKPIFAKNKETQIEHSKKSNASKTEKTVGIEAVPAF
ncbi:MAG: single-stranded DNA-binding protein [Treponema sp.]|nr:single-stranded DNA-binding protein [Treponema sp.]